MVDGGAKWGNQAKDPNSNLITPVAVGGKGQGSKYKIPSRSNRSQAFKNQTK